MPKPAPTDYAVTVDDVGVFTFAKRTMRLQLALDVEKFRLSEGLPIDGELALYIEAVATLKTLLVEGPEGWSHEDADPLDPGSFRQALQVWEALRESEETFRGASQKRGEEART